MRILITGGAGYIGSHIVDLLCDKGYKVIVYDNLCSGFKENLNKKSKFIFGDICNKDNLEKIFISTKIDSIIHMAALKSVNDSMNSLDSYSETNIFGSITNFIMICLLH